MAKSKKPKSPVTKKPSKQDLKQKALNKEYATQRKLLLQNVHRLEARGYDVSKIKIPQIPEKKNKKAINEIKRINANRYKYATHEVEVVKNKGRKNERIEVTKLKGTKYAKQENKIRAEKAAATRKQNRIEKQEAYKNLQFDKLAVGDITYDEYVSLTGEKIDSYEREKLDNLKQKYGIDKPEFRDAVIGGSYGSELDTADFGTWFNPETGEIKEGRKPRYGNWLMGQEAIDAYQKSVYETALKRVENMQIYEGKDKRARQIKSNADRIRQKIEEEYAKNPKAVTKVISEMATTGALDDVEVWYFAKGYDKFEYNFMMYLGLLDEEGIYDDETEFTDYDE